ncbi:hypothetical protein [Achromobacter deleyi]|uniref:hypothetical protein n=1 Tax=Achromobacter deleyi TaxID=1353891 RepID=UPI001F208364|nr:hypothetical protein [Achromobacter deleyi]UIP18463.1 hypothetical protein LYZ39_15675 [Achromobacter deleyi]
MKSLIAVAAVAALASWPALARDALPTVPQPPPSARTLPDACLGTSCPKMVDPGKINRDCLGTSCPGTRYPPAGTSPGQSPGQSGLKGPARPWLPPIPPRPGQPPVGPLTPAPALPR